MTAPAPARPAADAQAAALLATYQQSTQRLRDQLAAFIASLWRSLGSYRNDQMSAFTGQVVPVVAGAQQQMASLTAAYLAAHQAAALGTAFLPAPVDPALVSGAAVRGGATPQEVYERPFHLVWRQLAELPREPGSIEQAVTSGMDRAVQTGLTDLQLAKTHTAQRVLAKDSRIAGYRRVLEGAYSCALCVVASSQRYHKAQLMPMHPACDCSVAPLYGGTDPGQLVDPAALAAAHQAIADQFGRSSAGARAIPGAGGVGYRDVLVTHEHGELGPVLAIRGASYTGPGDLAKRKVAVADARSTARRTTKPAADYAAQADLLRRALPTLQARVDAGDRNLAPVVAARRKRIAELDDLAHRATR